METNDHIFASCPRARRIWDLLKIAIGEGDQRRPAAIGASLDFPPSVRLDVVLVLLWNIWKSRNALIFDGKDSAPSEVLRASYRDLIVWACKYKDAHVLIRAWANYIQNCIPPV